MPQTNTPEQTTNRQTIKGKQPKKLNKAHNKQTKKLTENKTKQ